MAIEILKYRDESGKETSLFVDIVGDMSSNRSSQLTEFPIEDGSVINDHLIHRPVSVSLSLGSVTKPIFDDDWSETSIDLKVRAVQTRVLSPFLLVGRAVSAGLQGAAALLGVGGNEPTGATVRKNPSPGNRQQDVYETLIRIAERGYFVTVNYDGRVYPDMILTELTKARAQADRGTMRFQCTFQTPRTVTTAGASLPNPADLRAKPRKKKGGKSKKEEGDAKKTSMLKYTKDALAEGLL